MCRQEGHESFKQQQADELGIEFSGLIIDDNEKKTLNLSYANFVIPLINGMKEQQGIIEGQEERLENQQKLIESLARRLEQVENRK